MEGTATADWVTEVWVTEVWVTEDTATEVWAMEVWDYIAPTTVLLRAIPFLINTVQDTAKAKNPKPIKQTNVNHFDLK